VFAFSAAGQNTQKQPALRVLLVEGQGAINIVNKKADRRLTVRVEEKFAVPAKGIVTFTLPDSGPSGSFDKKGARSVTVNTDDQGYAVARREIPPSPRLVPLEYKPEIVGRHNTFGFHSPTCRVVSYYFIGLARFFHNRKVAIPDILK
jgi:hypothetical protein